MARQKPQTLAALGLALKNLAKADAVPFLAAVQARHPDDFWVNFGLGNALSSGKKWPEAVGFYRAALAIRPSAAATHSNLGNAFAQNDQMDEAIQALRPPPISTPMRPPSTVTSVPS